MTKAIMWEKKRKEMVLKLFQYHIKKQISKDVTNKIEKMNYHLSKSESKDFMPCVGNL